ncbi:lipoate-protein ligase A [Hydrogenivirga caldilitoris]|uniref:Lipoate-protein ligase A n=1 Tax=Hydrogenivirga caldilitoris TaxID=246264 RepID=A0A497XPZ5_9AQUI|nr:lipoate--protein ligase [Hydrogenivirga caldilitoris]RLJ70341.1 lipoate-protein ligase A [Hydrogenivirga caldilitoris]
MRRDEEALLSFEHTPFREPSVRLYKWDRICLSLGYFQKEKPFLTVPTVRRPTGGGALLHGWDVSFSIVDLRERWGLTPSRIYRKVAEVFINSFSNLGIEVTLERFRGRYIDNFFCFWVPTLGELTYRKRKLVSMAMRTLKRSFLVHGSVYLDFDYERVQELIGVPAELLSERIVSLRELGIEEEEFITVFLHNLQRVIPLNLQV